MVDLRLSCGQAGEGGGGASLGFGLGRALAPLARLSPAGSALCAGDSVVLALNCRVLYLIYHSDSVLRRYGSRRKLTRREALATDGGGLPEGHTSGGRVVRCTASGGDRRLRFRRPSGDHRRAPPRDVIGGGRGRQEGRATLSLRPPTG